LEGPLNTEASIIDPARIERAIQQRYSPFPELTMERLSAQLNQFRIGELRAAARTWEIMLERDGDLAVPADKLFADIARLPWEIEKSEESAEAEAHFAALTYFYTHLSATSILDGDETGGLNLLLRQMMTAHAMRYSVHEMILQISSAGKKEVTAQFLHAPVWFFEARKGRLGFLKQEFAVYGEPLARGEWLPALGRGMMRQCSVAYLCKWSPLTYWALFCYRFGVPGIHGLTDAQEGSDEWNKFTAALSAFANDWVTATNRTAEIKLIEAAKGGTGTLPFQELVERSDRLYARAFRGGDLSTQSRGGSAGGGGEVAGANPQESEKEIVLQDGGQWATDVLNSRVDEPIIEYLFNARPKAWICIRPPKRSDVRSEIEATGVAIRAGVITPSEADEIHMRDRLSLPPMSKDVIREWKKQGGARLPITLQAEGAPAAPNNFNRPALANSANLQDQFAAALADKTDPVGALINRIVEIKDDEQMLSALQQFLARADVLSGLLASDVTKLQRALEQITAPALAAGLAGKATAA